jgi:carbamoyltransferase
MLKEPISINNSRAVLGVWDGHDAGAALVQDGQILFAVNEERFSRRKLEIGFPRRSIAWVLSAAELEPEDVTMVAASTSDFAKTLTRLFPGLREEYYLLRRRKKLPGAFYELKKSAKYLLTEWPPSRFSRTLSSFLLGRELKALGLSNARLHLVDHHLSHIACAALCSGFNDCLAVSLDGIGDGLSGRICSFSNGSLSTLAELPGSVSFGIFFEHVTNLLNMRELEDEGKVMALADFSSPVADDDNPLLKFLSIEGLTVSSPVPSRALYGELKRIFWQYPSEQFAKMAQRTLEVKVC